MIEDKDKKASAASGWGRVFELGPAYLTAIGTVIAALTAGGYFAGRATGQPSPQATVTVTATATPVVTSAPAQASSGQASPSASGAVANGTQLGSYNTHAPPFVTFPLDGTAPTQAQFVREGGQGDLSLDTNGMAGPGTDFLPANGNQMVQLPGGSTLSYSACTSVPGFVQKVDNTVGATFCILEGSGKVAGVTVTSIDSTAPYLTNLRVIVWQNVS